VQCRSVLMTPLEPADVVIEDATICLLNGSPVSAGTSWASAWRP
jgi:hypothetical protein